jgi:hypothetical protein
MTEKKSLFNRVSISEGPWCVKENVKTTCSQVNQAREALFNSASQAGATIEVSKGINLKRGKNLIIVGYLASFDDGVV